MNQLIGDNIIDSKDIARELENISEGKLEVLDITSQTKRNDSFAFLIKTAPKSLGIMEEDFSEDVELFEEKAEIIDNFLAEIFSSLELEDVIGHVSTYKFDESEKKFLSAMILMDELAGNKKLTKLINRIILSNM